MLRIPLKSLTTLPVLLLVLFLFHWPHNMQLETGEENKSNRVFMKMSGRVVQRETGKGIGGVSLRILDGSTGVECDAVSADNGYYEIKDVPPGNYEVNIWEIHKTCPPDLLVEKELKPFAVVLGENVSLDIFLRKGAAISGRIFGPDGITPITNGLVVVLDSFKHEGLLDNEGRFKISRLGFRERDGFSCKVIAKSPGYAHSFQLVKLRTGGQRENVDFVIGKGDIHVQGQVISALDANPIKNAKIWVLSLDRDSKKFADGTSITDEDGSYFIIGFANTGKVNISAFHDDFKSFQEIVELKKGINIFNFELNKEKTPLKPKDQFLMDQKGEKKNEK